MSLALAARSRVAPARSNVRRDLHPGIPSLGWLFAPLAPLLEPLQHDEDRRHERDRQQRRAQHAGQHRDADRLLRVGAGARGRAPAARRRG